MIPKTFDGAFIVNKPQEITSFGVVDEIKSAIRERTGAKPRDLPKLGHGGTLDPFAEGVLVVLCGLGVKLARHFLGASKSYEGIIRFGETTVPGDPTAPVTQRSDSLPLDLETIQHMATSLTEQDYLQTPPMHSAKKLNGKPLYLLAREGIEVDREAKRCILHSFEITRYEAPDACFRLRCSSGTYVRVLAQDMGRLLGGVAHLKSLTRTASGAFDLKRAASLDAVTSALRKQDTEPSTWPGWIPFDALLEGFDDVDATLAEQDDLFHGRQSVLFSLMRRKRTHEASDTLTTNRRAVAIYHNKHLIAIAGPGEHNDWRIENVFTAARE